MKRHRSVLSRLERVRILQEQGILTEESSVLGLPKVKHLKIRIRKEKAATAATGAGTTTAGAPSEAAPAAAPSSSAGAKPAAKGAAPAKPESGTPGKKKE